MNYEFSEIRFPSKDGIHTVYAEIYAPKDKETVGVVQLAHGMIDYVGRYSELADYLAGEGYVLAGNHHLGHGKTAEKEDDFGYFADSSGVSLVVSDMHEMNKRLAQMFPSKPIILMGHSMGSFLSRLYAVKYPHSIKGLIIHGTSGPNPLLPFGKLLARLIKLIRGGRYRSLLIKNLAFGSYNKRFPKEEGEDAWLTREISLVSGRSEDKYTSFRFTVSGYIDLFSMISRSNSADWFKSYPKAMPTLVISGDMDPVGNYGKGPDYVYKRLMIEGCENIALKMYGGARHELFNETNRSEVFSDLVKWIKSI